MEQLSIFDLIYPKYQITKPIRLLELFAGVGTFAMALRDLDADFEYYRMIEIDKYAVASYNAIHGTDFTPMDIMDVKGSDLGIIDTDKYTYLMTYSFPCQDLSLAGKRKGMDRESGTRSSLLWEVQRLLDETENLPELLVMENVPQVMTADGWYDWTDYLTDRGYKNFAKILNAKDYGVAQNRERCFMVSILGDYSYSFPEPIPLEKTMNDYLEDDVDESYYVNNDKAKELIQELVDSGRLDNETSNSIRGRQRFSGQTQMGHDSKPVGYLENGTGEHQSNEVFETDSLSRTLTASDYKCSIKIIDKNNE